MIHLTTISEPVLGETGDFLAVAPGRPIVEALDRLADTLGNADAVLGMIPQAQHLERERLAYACAELLYTARALLASVNCALKGETEEDAA